jgi:hypothetical protein
MRLGKTERARAALENAKAAGLDLRDRRILILADGKRTRGDLLALLGVDHGTAVDRLVRDGYLADPESYAMATATPAAAATTPVMAAATPLAAASSKPASARRSLAAAKMYLIDMLQLQRTPVAAELRLALQRTSDPDVLVDAMVDALAHLLTVTTPSYGERVRTRVAEVVPEEAVPRFAHLSALAPAIAS